ncbi:MAG: acetolactate synthase small subunit [Bacillati bacterium ANGP1]|uniref:Acetolactate synthase small subunit n=1 Tax=Candidatus Segetimicrobium genomatis TaxID=2569760 RepID=A0A537LAX7_9BACT|nr:MAG: acetolactate synthase small subunit [Terrabacteria group bacterium ANGP1]TMJ09041.1 MAG: acetolactate synthase small subunit [Terrabacteria group bacterium ANGP1]TMJ13191.1 MAG: acetolactate synthase small subunit [Terrabacteria group bacterium ANGP1]HTE02764.1 acetolactate synthase small subunit [bacterium]HTE03954.1 acetolactate synthase small subunit [bacterium]
MTDLQHAATISVLVQNAPGVLVRVAGLIRRRGVNIHSLSVGPTEDPSISRMTIVVDTAPERTEQFAKQLRKLVEVLRATSLDSTPAVDRELALIKVNVTPGTRLEIMEIANVFRASVVDLTDKTMTLEVTGRGEKVDAFVTLLTKYGIREMARTGQVTLVRGSQNT